VKIALVIRQLTEFLESDICAFKEQSESICNWSHRSLFSLGLAFVHLCVLIYFESGLLLELSGKLHISINQHVIEKVKC